MTEFLTLLKTSGRAAIVAVTLGAASLTAMPVAYAQSGPSMNFNLELGNGDRGGGDRDSARGRGGDRDFGERRRGDDFGRFCLNDREIRRGLGRYGFDDVDVRRDIGRNRVEVIARYGRAWYSMRVNRCTGEVNRVERIRRGGGPNFGLQFEF